MTDDEWSATFCTSRLPVLHLGTLRKQCRDEWVTHKCLSEVLFLLQNLSAVLDERLWVQALFWQQRSSLRRDREVDTQQQDPKPL